MADERDAPRGSEAPRSEAHGGSAAPRLGKRRTSTLARGPLAVEVRSSRSRSASRAAAPVVPRARRCAPRRRRGRPAAFTLTEGVIAGGGARTSRRARRGRAPQSRRRRGRAAPASWRRAALELAVSIAASATVVIELDGRRRAAPARRELGRPARRAADRARAPGTAQGFDQRGRRGRARAPTAATRAPTARRSMLETGGIPQGDYAPAPWLLSSAGLGAVGSRPAAPGSSSTSAERRRGLGARRGRAAAPAPADRPDARRAAAPLPAG